MSFQKPNEINVTPLTFELICTAMHGIRKSGDWEIGRRRDNKKKIKGDEGIRESDDQETGRACSIVPTFQLT
jgi:hypothetical protein